MKASAAPFGAANERSCCEPMSVTPADHGLRLDGLELWTWCAFDAVGLPAALGVDGVVRTRCAYCRTALEINLPKGQPPNDSTVVGWLPDRPCVNVQADFCPEANLYCTSDHLSRWREAAGDPPGDIRTLGELAALGTDVWAETSVTTEQPDCSGKTTPELNASLLYFTGCPNWRIADRHLRDALGATGYSATQIRYRKVETVEDAERVGFAGSPSILIDGVDPFADAGAPVGLSCRVYPTPHGLSGAPTVEQLKEVLQSRTRR